MRTSTRSVFCRCFVGTFSVVVRCFVGVCRCLYRRTFWFLFCGCFSFRAQYRSCSVHIRRLLTSQHKTCTSIPIFNWRGSDISACDECRKPCASSVSGGHSQGGGVFVCVCARAGFVSKPLHSRMLRYSPSPFTALHPGSRRCRGVPAAVGYWSIYPGLAGGSARFSAS